MARAQRKEQPENLTVVARIPRIAPGATQLDIENAAWRCMATLVELVREAGGDSSQIIGSRISLSDTGMYRILTAVRAEIFGDCHSNNTIGLMAKDAPYAVVAELEVARHAA